MCITHSVFPTTLLFYLCTYIYLNFLSVAHNIQHWRDLKKSGTDLTQSTPLISMRNIGVVNDPARIGTEHHPNIIKERKKKERIAVS
jgi:hypothetical protein